MKDTLKIVYEGGIGEIEEKKSRFIATVRPVHSEEEAAAFLEEIRKKIMGCQAQLYVLCCGGESGAAKSQ